MESNVAEEPVTLQCNDNALYGILSVPKQQAQSAVIIVVGGPQYRVGSHRQFTLLARYLANHGLLALRFDYTGMGYSEGNPKKFYQIDDDIKTAITYISENFQAIEKIYLWGLCDAASAISFFAYRDKRVNGIVLMNPWVRNENSHSQVVLSNYYRDRFLSVEVWKQLLMSPRKALIAAGSFFNICLKVFLGMLIKSDKKEIQEITIEERMNNLPAAVLKGRDRFDGRICLILSENDLTADEFKREFDDYGYLDNDENNSVIHHVQEADHTFSSARWRAKVEKLTLEFVKK